MDKDISADTDAIHLMTAKSDVRILMGEKAYLGADAAGILNGALRRQERALTK